MRAKVGMDSAEFTKGVQSLSKQMSVIKAEFKLTSGSLDNVKNAMQLAQQRAKSLGDQIVIQKKIVGEFKAEQKRLADEYGATSKQALDYELKIKRSEITLQNLERQLKDTNKQLGNQGLISAQVRDKLVSLGSAMQKTGEKMAGIGKKMTVGITAPIVAAMGASVKYASDLEESTNKVNVAFQASSTEVLSWAKTTLRSYGIAKGSALEMASLFGDMGTAMGQTPADAAKMSMSLVGLAGDLASFKNISIEQAQNALRGIFTGEGESLKTLGIVMQDSTLKAYALATGQQKGYSEMTQAEKVALRYSFVMNSAQNAQGDFARTGGGTANQMRVVQESIKEAAGDIGTLLLPSVASALKVIGEWIQKFSSLDEGTQKTILVVAGLAAALGPTVTLFGNVGKVVGGATKLLGINTKATAAANGVSAIAKVRTLAQAAATKIASAAQAIWNGIMTANPIALVILGLALLALAIYAVVKHWKQIVEWVKKAWDWLTKWNQTPAEDKDATFTENRVVSTNNDGTAQPGELEQRAVGDRSWRGGLVRVHEKGGEILNLPNRTTIIPHDVSMELARQTARASGGGAFPSSINVTGSIRVVGVNDQGQFVAAADYAAEKVLRDLRGDSRR